MDLGFQNSATQRINTSLIYFLFQNGVNLFLQMNSLNVATLQKSPLGCELYFHEDCFFSLSPYFSTFVLQHQPGLVLAMMKAFPTCLPH